MLKLAPPLVALLVAALLAACGDATEQTTAPTSPSDTATAATAADTPAPAPEAKTSAPTADPTASPTPTETPTPGDWTAYVDPVLGFSLQYPPDLAFADLTAPSPAGGLSQRAIEFRSPTDASRAFVISVSDNTKGLTLEEWAFEFAACRPKSIQQGMLGGIAAIVCTREIIEGQPRPAVLAEHEGRITLMSGHLTDSEFSQITGSFHF